MTSHPRLPPAVFNPWPWALIGFFTVLVTAIASFIVFAVRQDMELVRPDYYEQELRHDLQMERIRRTSGVACAIGLERSGQDIVIQVPTVPGGARPSGSIQLYRPSDSRLDRQVDLAPDDSGRQALDAAGLRPGLWRVRVAWSAGGADFFREATLVIPTPAPTPSS